MSESRRYVIEVPPLVRSMPTVRLLVGGILGALPVTVDRIGHVKDAVSLVCERFMQGGSAANMRLVIDCAGDRVRVDLSQDRATASAEALPSAASVISRLQRLVQGVEHLPAAGRDAFAFVEPLPILVTPPSPEREPHAAWVRTRGESTVACPSPSL